MRAAASRPSSCLFGSDRPVVTLAGSSERWTDAVLAVLGTLDAGERQGVLAGNAERVYGLAGQGTRARGVPTRPTRT